MSTKATPFPAVAGGNIKPSTFIKGSRTADRTLLNAGANDPIIGISGVGTNIFQDTSNSLGVLAASGQEFDYFMDGEPCSLLLGGTVAAFDCLRSDANSAAVTGSPGENIGAIALEAGVSGDYIKALPFIQVAGGFGSSGGAWRDVTATTVLTAADGGCVIAMTLVTSGIITLPPTSTLSAGWRVTAVSRTATTSGAGLLVEPNGSDTAYVYGGGLSGAYTNNKGFLNTQATSAIGDSVTVIFDGTNFFVTSKNGTWAKEP